MSTRILLVEDDPNLGLVLQEYLQIKAGYQVKLCKDGEEGLKAFFSDKYDLCIFDVMMPKKDGFTLGKEVRAVNQEIPIIYATAKSMMEDKIEGFQLGADDYITKPFRIEELLLRIQAILKRLQAVDQITEERVFNIGKFEFDYLSQTLNDGNINVKMSGKEADLLKLLCLRKNQILTREEALLKIWNDDSYFNGRSMDVYLSKIRKYLKSDVSIEIINVHGKGFKLIELMS
jgi:DNA-binding response OmpR family regulator